MMHIYTVYGQNKNIKNSYDAHINCVWTKQTYLKLI